MPFALLLNKAVQSCASKFNSGRMTSNLRYPAKATSGLMVKPMRASA